MIPQNKQSGFSLIELVVVMSIITVLAGAAVPALTKSLTRARAQDTRAELAALEQAITAYFEDTGIFPPTFSDLESNDASTPGWVGPYLRALSATAVGKNMSLSQDAWQQDYIVTLRQGVELTISSPGVDGKKKTADDMAVVIDVTPILRRQTLAELAVINGAVLSYNRDFLPDAPLPQAYASLLQVLEAGGYLPGGTDRYEADAWGHAYQPDPKNQVPIVQLTSKHL